MITAGVTRPKVTLSDFRKLRIARPTLSEQQLIAHRLQLLTDLFLSESAGLDLLQKLKPGLVHDLLTGRVRVSFEEPTTT